MAQVQTAPVKHERLTSKEIKSILPSNFGGTVDKNFENNLNDILKDPELCMNFRDNFVGFANILSEGKFKLTDYVNAVKYVSYQFLGNNNKQSYIKTFPDRYNAHLANNTSDKDISSYIAAYNRSKLVSLLREQALIPVWVNNQPLFQRALETQAELMLTAKSEKVRSDAADSILKHVKPPESVKMEVDVTDKRQVSAIDKFTQSVKELVDHQQQALTSGQSSISEIAASEIIEHDSEDEG